MFTRTIDSIRETLTLSAAIDASTKSIEILSQDDAGEWHSRMFANEAAAAEYEATGRKRGFQTRREG